MPKSASVLLAETVSTSGGALSGGGTAYLVQTPADVLYAIFVDSGADLAYRKSIDGGLTWSSSVGIFTGTISQFAVWYDRWSGLSTDNILFAYTDTGVSDTMFRTLDTTTDTLSTQTVIFAGVSAVQIGGCLSIARSRGGNTYCRVTIDAGAEGGFFRLPVANFPNGAWDAAKTIDETLATSDQVILLPGWAADNQDMIMIFWDASADEISRKLYDDSANTWAETSIATGYVDLAPSNTTPLPHFAAAVDIANSQNILIAWSAIDTANADLRCWKITEGAITESATNVVLNSTDDQGLAALTIDANNNWWAFYVGKSDGSETFFSAANIYCKASTDQGVTWGPETLLTPEIRAVKTLIVVPRYVAVSSPFPPPVSFFDDMIHDEIRIIVPISLPRASYQLVL
jgi:hypothetical protein